MKKNSSVVKIIALALVITALTVCEILYIGNHKTIPSDEQIGCTAETLAETDGYSTDSNTFTRSSNDAFFVINDSLTKTEKINIFFDKPLMEGTKITVYGKHDPTASEKKIASTVTEEDSKSCYLDVKDGTYALLKFVVDTDSFTLKKITVAGENEQTNYPFIVLFTLLFLGLDIFIVLRIVQVWRKEKNEGHCLNKKEYVRTLVLFLSVFLVMAETELFFVYSNLTHYDIMGANPDTLLETDGYDIDIKYVSPERKRGAKKILVPQDSYATFTVGNALCETNYIVFYFLEPPSENTKLKIYCQEDPGIDDTPVQIYQLDKGKTQQRFELPTGSYKALKIHIDIPVTLEKIEVSGRIQLGKFMQLLYLLVIIITNVLLVLWCMDILSVLKYLSSIITSSRPFCTYTTISESIYSKLSKKITIEKFFVIMTLAMGITFSFLIPISQTPDEHTHLNNILSVLGCKNISQSYNDFMSITEMSTTLPPYSERQDFDLYLQSLSIKTNTSIAQINPQPSIRFLWYLPAILGILTGIICQFPLFWCMQIAKLFSLGFYALVGYKSLQYMPIKKELLCAIMLLPMCIQQNTSINYDAVLHPLCFFVIAYILHFRFSGKTLKWKHAIVILGLLSIILTMKPPYILLGLMLFSIPIAQYDLCIGKINIIQTLFRYKFIFIPSMFLLMCIAFYIGHKNIYLQILQFMGTNPIMAIRLLFNTFTCRITDYIQSFVGNFGWLDALVANWYLYFVILSLCLFTQVSSTTNNNQMKIQWTDRILSLSIFFATATLVLISMILWSMALQNGMFIIPPSENPLHVRLANLDVISGVQGRYFIPIAFLFFFGISLPITIKKHNMLLLGAVYYIVSFVYPVTVLLDRYWI